MPVRLSTLKKVHFVRPDAAAWASGNLRGCWHALNDQLFSELLNLLDVPMFQNRHLTPFSLLMWKHSLKAALSESHEAKRVSLEMRVKNMCVYTHVHGLGHLKSFSILYQPNSQNMHPLYNKRRTTKGALCELFEKV